MFPKYLTAILIILAILLSATHIFAWQDPTIAPPGGNVTVGGLWAAGAGNDIYRLNGRVGIGIAAPNKLLHLKTPVGTNAEINIQTGNLNHWAIYQDEGTEQLRFWNGDNRLSLWKTGKVEVPQNSVVQVGNAYLSSGGNYMHLANNEWYNGSAWIANAAGALIQMSGQDITFYRHDAAGVHNSSGGINSGGNWTSEGNLTVRGVIQSESGKPAFLVNVWSDDCGWGHPYLGCPGGYTNVGQWHVGGAGCDASPRGVGYENGTISAGWMALCMAN
ncbi:MAG: hypothetical protein HY602_03420 [Parcubacteria group bacterium]|nr:hypothetical protein [Parcubacteria group bacterium]